MNAFTVGGMEPERRKHLFTLHWLTLDTPGICPVRLTVNHFADGNYQPISEPAGKAAAVEVTAEVRVDLNSDNRVTVADARPDGEINILDALTVAQCSGLFYCTQYDGSLADFNLDGRQDIVDALLIARYAAGIIDEF